MSFLVTGFLVGLLGGSLGSGGEHYDFHTPFLEEISGERMQTKSIKSYVGTPMLLLVLLKGGEQHLEKFESYGLDDLDDFRWFRTWDILG